MKFRTAIQLEEELERELAWRKKELITFKLLIDAGLKHQADALRRAGVALLYAHWEGLIKNAGTVYVDFVANQRMTHRQLGANFLALAIKSKLLMAAESSEKHRSTTRWQRISWRSLTSERDSIQAVRYRPRVT